MTIRSRTALTVIALLAVFGSLVLTAAPGKAASESQSLTMSCSFTSPSPGTSPFSTVISLSAPDTVEPGQQFTITARTSPMVSGPARAEAGDSVVSMILDVTGTSGYGAADQRTTTWANSEPIEPFASFSPGPVSLTLTAPATPQELTVQFDQTQIWVGLLSTYLNCWAWDGSSRATPSLAITVASGDTTTTTEPGDTTTTTEPGDTTTTTEPGDTTSSTVGETTSSTVESTTSSTIPQADTVSASQTVVYGCTPFVSGSNLGTESASQSITISAPDRVNPGDAFSVTIKMSPGPENGPVPLAAGTQRFKGTIGVSGGGSPATLNVSGGTNSSDIAPNAVMRIPAMRGKVTATGQVGDSISYRPGTFTIDSPSLDARTVCKPTSQPIVLSTNIVAEPVAVSEDGSLPATGVGQYALPLAAALFALYLGGLFLSALPRRQGEERP
ncbi:MAG: hypothetical protein ACR2N2_01705 [Acidimicrobiia bacterium]